MKKYIAYFLVVNFMINLLTSCNNKNNLNNNNNKPQKFESIKECAQKAQNDMIEVLTANKNLSPNLDISLLKSSTLGMQIPINIVDFDKMQSSKDSDFTKMFKFTNSEIVTFEKNISVNATAVVNKKSAGYEVAQLFNREYTENLNSLRTIYKNDISKISYFEVPNIDAHIFEITTKNQTFYHLNYKSIFNLSQPVTKESLNKVLVNDTIEFKRKYGDLLKKGKLLN